MSTMIFGATGGVGSALARNLVVSGRAVHLVGRNAERLEALGDELQSGFTVGDALDPELYARAVADAGSPLDGLVYAIGSITLKPLGRTTDDDLLQDFRLNALGAAQAIRAALPALKAGAQPSIVLFSSVAAGRGFASHASVAMAKGAVEALTRSMAAELAPRIRVNCIAPSLTRTPLAASLTATEQMSASLAHLHPLQRLGEVEDIVGLTEFLLSAKAGWMTGQVIGVDGGRSTLAGRSQWCPPDISIPVLINEGDHRLNGRSSSAWAKYAEALRRISLACRSSRFSRSRDFNRSAVSVVTPAPLPLSTSAFLSHSLSAVVDGLKGFPDAINAAFPETTVQTCIVHLLRHSPDFVSYKDRKPIATALKEIYRAVDAAAAEVALTGFEQTPWGQKYPAIGQSWRRA